MVLRGLPMRSAEDFSHFWQGCLAAEPALQEGSKCHFFGVFSLIFWDYLVLSARSCFLHVCDSSRFWKGCLAGEPALQEGRKCRFLGFLWFYQHSLVF